MDPAVLAWFTGAVGALATFTAWLIKAYISDLKTGYEARIKDKDAQIVAWQAAAQEDAKTSVESLQIAREIKATLDRVEKDGRLRARREREPA